MTPEERAEKIIASMAHETERDFVKSLIAAEIRAAVEGDCNTCDRIAFIRRCDNCVDDVRAGAYEDAAKIVENPPYDLLDEGVFLPTLAGIAKAIRTRAAEVGK